VLKFEALFQRAVLMETGFKKGVKLILLLTFSLSCLTGKVIVTPKRELKPYYYEGEEVNLSLKIISPSPSLLHIGVKPTPEQVLLVHPTDFIYELNLTFFASKKLPIMEIDGINNFTKIPLNRFIKIQPLPTPIPANFAGVVANRVEVMDPEASYFDQNRTRIILSFNLKSEGGTISRFKLKGILEENLTPITSKEGKYYAILPINTEKINFYYFSPEKEGYLPVTVPVNLKIDEVATQTDIKPETNFLANPINIILLGVALIGFIAVLVYQRWWLFIFPAGVLGYFFYINIPYQEEILKAGAQVQILPTPHSTTFFIPSTPMRVKILKHYRNYTKIYFNNQVGWVKNGQLQ